MLREQGRYEGGRGGGERVGEGEEDCSGGLEKLCVDVCCCPRKCVLIIAYGSAAVFAFAMLDMVGDQQGVVVALWAPLLVILLPAVLIIALKALRVGDADQAVYIASCAQQATAETNMILRNTIVSAGAGGGLRASALTGATPAPLDAQAVHNVLVKLKSSGGSSANLVSLPPQDMNNVA